MAITNEDVDAANRRAVQTQATHAVATAVRYDGRRKRIVLRLDSGVELVFAPHLAHGLEGACTADLADAQISPSGLGLHFPALNADLYLPTLLEGLFGSRRWLAVQNGRAGGKAQSLAKAQAARSNGARGGRPKKPVSVERTDPLTHQ